MSEEWADYESGPFCRHWGDPVDCERVCKTCGHTCCEHTFADPGECAVDGCPCEEWTE